MFLLLILLSFSVQASIDYNNLENELRSNIDSICDIAKMYVNSHEDILESTRIRRMMFDSNEIALLINDNPEPKKIKNPVIHHTYNISFIHLLAHFSYSVTLLELIIKRNPEAIFIQDKSGNSLIHYAAWHGNLPVVQTILKYIRNSDELTNKEGSTALMYACISNHMKISRVLCLNGADIYKKNQFNDFSYNMCDDDNKELLLLAYSLCK